MKFWNATIPEIARAIQKWLKPRCDHFWMVGGYTVEEANSRWGDGPNPETHSAAFLYCARCRKTRLGDQFKQLMFTGEIV